MVVVEHQELQAQAVLMVRLVVVEAVVHPAQADKMDNQIHSLIIKQRLIQQLVTLVMDILFGITQLKHQQHQ
jgi:hypothetical protein